MRLDFCAACGRIVLRGFSFCPYCGTALKTGSGLEEALERPFERLDAMQSGERERRVDELLAELDALELDMDEFLHASEPPHTPSSGQALGPAADKQRA
ncbi:MAG: hypothetical protein JW923_04950 [Spirochaetales bacterium]|nr:hypothetical protein [Spirochaetales bacterium]MBP7264521.1 hypothetical protein [Spirochaetia bacterium]